MNEQYQQTSRFPDNFKMMQELLSSWNVTELCDHFEDEGISVEEMELMKPQHVSELLRNYKMGVRIRFEHHFELWRRRLNKPLPEQWVSKSGQCCCHSLPKCSSLSATTSPVLAAPRLMLRTRATNTQLIEQSDAETHTSKSPTPSSPLLTQLPTEILQELPHLTPQPKHLMGKRNAVPPAPPQGSPSRSPSPVQAEAPQAASRRDVPPISLLKILKAEGVKGISLLQDYKQHGELTNVHRAMLVTMIVGFFVENDFHLSLNMSHNLEAQILRLFPSEKLENYRTEKRGKIYVKFCNMKRYRRDRCKTKRKWDGTMPDRPALNRASDLLEPSLEDDDIFMGLENWTDQVQVKTEDYTGDEF